MFFYKLLLNISSIILFASSVQQQLADTLLDLFNSIN